MTQLSEFVRDRLYKEYPDASERPYWFAKVEGGEGWVIAHMDLDDMESALVLDMGESGYQIYRYSND